MYGYISRIECAYLTEYMLMLCPSKMRDIPR